MVFWFINKTISLMFTLTLSAAGLAYRPFGYICRLGYRYFTDKTPLSSVYIIKSHSCYYKIGMTKRCVQKRLKEFKTANPLPLKLILELKTSRPFNLENRLHKLYSSKRVRKDGEWFRLMPKDIKKLKNCQNTYLKKYGPDINPEKFIQLLS